MFHTDQDPLPTNNNYFHLNNISMRLPTGTSLLELALVRQLPANQNFAPNIIPLKYGDVVDVIYNNLDGGSHPLHLHGHLFW